ncbi:hypothetical protein QE152_g24959 [Popillia japonica]|uniref:DUF8207 domain-containing protein n=1 Tax=Popillia japonica TaxID=7064 RepID=A0AAW1K3J1_POPJA
MKTAQKNKLIFDIVKVSKAIRKKHLQLKLGRTAEDELFKRMYKPIPKPIQELLTNIKSEAHALASPLGRLRSTIKSDGRSIKTPTRELSKAIKTIQPPMVFIEEKQEKPLAIQPATTIKEPTLYEISPQVNEIEDVRPYREIIKEYREFHLKTLNEKPYLVNDLFGSLNSLPKKYIDEYLIDTEGNYDISYGVRFDPKTRNLTLGTAKIAFKGDNIIIGNKSYKGTPGLYELIYKSRPGLYTEKDVEAYYNIMQQTHIHKRKNNPTQLLRGTNTYKWREVMKPIIEKFTGQSTGGNLVVDMKTPYQYVYWDNINELVDRLRLLIASEQAGNTSHNNEIVSIIEELKEAGVIE